MHFCQQVKLRLAKAEKLENIKLCNRSKDGTHCLETGNLGGQQALEYS